jgi:IS5 family transposase
VGTPANVADVTQVDQLLHGEETYVSGDAGYTGVEKPPEHHQHRQMIGSIAARPSSYMKHAKKSLIGRMRRKIEHAKVQVRAKVEHPFRVIKRQSYYTKVRFRGLVKNTAQQTTLLAFCLVEPVEDAKTAVECRRGAPAMRTISPKKVLFRKNSELSGGKV